MHLFWTGAHPWPHLDSLASKTKEETMESIEHTTETKRTEYEQPKVVDYGTLLELTEANGTVNPSDVPHGHPNTAFPLS
jgi:hypothetical protein